MHILLEIDEQSYHKRLTVDKHVTYHEKSSDIKSYNEYKKMSKLVLTQELELRRMGHSIINLTNWTTLIVC